MITTSKEVSINDYCDCVLTSFVNFRLVIYKLVSFKEEESTQNMFYLL